MILLYDMNYWDIGSNKRPVPRGTHGYLNDHKEMWPFFVAHGPAFKQGYIVTGKFDFKFHYM